MKTLELHYPMIQFLIIKNIQRALMEWLLIILAFWLVLAYDLLEDRCTIDVIITKFFPLPS